MYNIIEKKAYSNWFFKSNTFLALKDLLLINKQTKKGKSLAPLSAELKKNFKFKYSRVGIGKFQTQFKNNRTSLIQSF